MAKKDYTINVRLSEIGIEPYGENWEQLNEDFVKQYDEFVDLMEAQTSKDEKVTDDVLNKKSDELVELFNELHDIEEVEEVNNNESSEENENAENGEGDDGITEQTSKEKAEETNEDQKVLPKTEGGSDEAVETVTDKEVSTENQIPSSESGEDFAQKGDDALILSFLKEKKSNRIDIGELRNLLGDNAVNICRKGGEAVEFIVGSYKFIPVSSEIILPGVYNIWDIYEKKA